MQEELELLLKKITELEKRLEKYYQFLKMENELNFIINGTYLLNADINNVLQGIY